MAILKLKTITCAGQAESFTDELYVTFNGTKTSLPGMTLGQTKPLNTEFIFEGSHQLSLFEDDGNHWYDRDDFIASIVINDNVQNRSLEFIASSGNALGAHYIINIAVEDENTPQPTAILRLNSISCIEQAETFTDELYVTFNGTKRYLPDMTIGQVKTLGDEFLFEGVQELSLFENDGNHWYDRDDFIGKHTITQSSLNTTLEFKATSGHGYPGHYLISVTVTPVGGLNVNINVNQNVIKK